VVFIIFFFIIIILVSKIPKRQSEMSFFSTTEGNELIVKLN
jgi:hypothetical protein